MNILFTADIHLGYARGGPGSRRFLENLTNIGDLDAIVIIGDLAENGPESTDETFKHHRIALELVKRTGCPNIAFCAGSHDIWRIRSNQDSWEIFHDGFYDLAREFGVVYLERENLYLSNIAIAGTMAHYDYSMAEEGLIFNGITVRMKHFRDKIPPGYDEPIWGDAKWLVWKYDDPTACKLILDEFEKRLNEANQKSEKIIAVSHTVPIDDINGHIFSDNLKSRFLNAYSGTSYLNEILIRQNSNEKIIESISGHTHIKMGPIVKNGIRYRNLGGDYGSPRYEIIEV